jgi:hypothetical protein
MVIGDLPENLVEMKKLQCWRPKYFRLNKFPARGPEFFSEWEKNGEY